MQRDESSDIPELGHFGSQVAQESILNQWAAKLSAQGAAITLSLPQQSDMPSDERVQSATGGSRINYLPTKIFNPDSACWEAISR